MLEIVESCGAASLKQTRKTRGKGLGKYEKQGSRKQRWQNAHASGAQYLGSSDKSPLMHSITIFKVLVIWHDCSGNLG
jgi:hypothetical protein